MPRRKSTTLGDTTSPMKRSADEEDSNETVKKRKNSETSQSQESLPKSPRGTTLSAETDFQGISSAKAGCDIPPDVLAVEEVGTIEIHEDIPATSVCEETVVAEDVTGETNNDDGSGALSERRNLSLEALFQVTDSELQNMSRETRIISGPTSLGGAGDVIVLGQLKSIVAPEKKVQAVVVDKTGTLAENVIAQPQCQVENIKVVCSQTELEECEGNQEVVYQIISSSVPSTPTVINVTGVYAAGRKRKHPQKPGRHICPFCGRGCAKPSVLQKHLRAHTGERPYPCVPCGFSFKTKSNLYKHCKSRSHAIKAGAKDANTGKEKDYTPDEKPGAAAEDVEDAEDEEDEETAEGSEGSDGEGGNREGEEEEGASKEVMVVHDEKVKQESILVNIRQKIDRNKLMEWSRKVEKQQKQQNDALLQAHSQFPVKIAPKSESAQSMEVGESSVTEMEDVSEGDSVELIGQPAVLAASKVDSDADLKEGGSQLECSELTVMASAVKKENFSPSSESGHALHAVSVQIPPPSSDPSEATRALRQLEMLSERVQQATVKGIPISTSFYTLPNKSIKVTIQLPKIEQKSGSKDQSGSSYQSSPVVAKKSDQTSVCETSAAAGSGQDSRPLSSEMLKERIQNLINANAAIIDMPMADPPRPRARGIARQYSDFYVYSWKLSNSEPTGSSTSDSRYLVQAQQKMLMNTDAQAEAGGKGYSLFPVRKAIQEKLAKKIADTRRKSLSDAEGERVNMIPSNVGQEIKIKIKLTPKMASEMSAANPVLKTEVSDSSPAVSPVKSSALRMQLSNNPLQSSNIPDVSVKEESSESSSVIKDLLSKGSAGGTITGTPKTVEESKQIPYVVELMENNLSGDAGKEECDDSELSDEYGEFCCPHCKVSFKRSLTLQIHTSFYCEQRNEACLGQGGAGLDAQEVFSKMGKDIVQKYFPVNSPPPPLLRSQSCPASAASSLEDASALKPGLIFENINDPSKPRKKGRPKGSKNRPKDLHVIPQANLVTSITGGPATPQTPSQFKMPTPSTPVTPRLVVASPSANHDTTTPSIPAIPKVVPLSSLSPLTPGTQIPQLTTPTQEVNVASENVRPIATSLQVNKLLGDMVSRPGHIILSPGGMLLQGSPAVLSPLAPSATIINPPGSIPLKSVAMPMIGQPMVTTARTPVSSSSVAGDQTPLTPQTPTDSGSSLWKMKLKGKLLLKRSMSGEKPAQDKEMTCERVIDLTDDGSKSAVKTPAPARQLSFPDKTTPHSPAKKICPDKTSNPLPSLNLPHLVMLTDKTDEEAMRTHNLPIMADKDKTKRPSSPIIVPSSVIPMEALHIPVAVAQPFFMNYQIPRAVYHSPSGSRLLTVLNSVPLAQQLLSTTGSSASVRTPEVQKKKLTTPLQYEKGLNSSTAMQLRAKLAEKLVSSQTSKDSSEGPETETETNVSEKIVLQTPDKEVITLLQSPGKECNSNVSTQSSVDEQHKDMLKIKDEEAALNKDAITKSAISVLLYGHSYPSLCGDTHISFCCVQKLQPMYVQIGKNKKISMYSNWRVASHNPNPEGLTSKMLLSLYKSHYTSNPVVNESKIMDSSEGILTHSSYWTYKRKQNGEENKLTDPCSKAVEVVEREESVELEKEKPLPMEITVVEKEGEGDEGKKVKETKVTKRIQICQGGYKTTEDYVYVRGRGRGKYVCEKCGIRCKKPSMLKKHIRTHTDFRPYNCRHCRFSFKTKGNLTKHMKSKAHQKKCMEIGVVPVPITIDETQIDNEALAAQCAIANDARIVDAKMFSTFPPENEDEENEDDEEEEEEEEEEGEEEDNSGGQDTAAENTSVVCDDLEMTCISTHESEEKASSPVFVALQVSDSNQPALVPIATQVSRPDNLFAFTDVSAAQKKASTVPSQNIDTEIARSLLDLSKKAEQGESSSTDLIITEGQRGITRLDSLIGALMSRTKPLSGLKPQDDSSVLMMKIAPGGDSSDRTPIAGEVNPADNFIVAMVSLSQSSDFENRSTTVGVPVVLSSAPSPGLRGSVVNPSLIAFLPPYATVPLPRPVAAHGPIIGQMILQNSFGQSQHDRSMMLPQILLPDFIPASSSPPSSSSSVKSSLISSTAVTASSSLSSSTFASSSLTSSSITLSSTSSMLTSSSVLASSSVLTSSSSSPSLTSSSSAAAVAPSSLSINTPGCKPGTLGTLPFLFSHPFGGVLTPTPTENLTEKTFAALKTVSDSPSGQTTSLTSVDKTSATYVHIRANSLSDSQPDLASAPGEETQMFYIYPAPSSGSGDAPGPSVVLKEGAIILSPTDGAVNPQQQIVYLISDVPNTAATVETKGSFTCDLCDTSFDQSHLLMLHRANVHQTGYQCSICHQDFRSEQQLLEHQSISGHSKQQETGSQLTALQKSRSFPCSFCDIVFRERGQLSKHLRSKLHVTTLERLGMLPAGTFQTLEWAKEGSDSQKHLPDSCEESGAFDETKGNSLGEDQPRRSDSVDECVGKTKRNVQSPFKEQFHVHQSSDYEKHDSASNEHVTVEINQQPIDLFDIRDIDTTVESGQENPHVSYCYQLLSNVNVNKAEVKMTESSGCVKHSRNNTKTSTPSLQYLLTSAAFSQINAPSVGGSEDMMATAGAKEHNKTESPAVVAVTTLPERSVDGQTPPNVSEGVHKCGICQTSFKGLDQLKSHLISHAELRPYVCEYCDAGFTNAHSLSSHLQTHKLFEPFSMTHERPYICGLCGDAFAEADDLKAHHATHSRPLRQGFKPQQSLVPCGDTSTSSVHTEQKQQTKDETHRGNPTQEINTEVQQSGCAHKDHSNCECKDSSSSGCKGSSTCERKDGSNYECKDSSSCELKDTSNFVRTDSSNFVHKDSSVCDIKDSPSYEHRRSSHVEGSEGRVHIQINEMEEKNSSLKIGSHSQGNVENPSCRLELMEENVTSANNTSSATEEIPNTDLSLSETRGDNSSAPE